MTKTIGIAIFEAARQLSIAGIDSSQLDARVLMSSVLKVAPYQASLIADKCLTKAQLEEFSKVIQRRLRRVPVSHILGYRDFFEHRFIVTPDVLDPRPETELLVVEALKESFQNVLDLGTGSGCILLSLLAKKINVQGVGIDISAAAISIARRNAKNLHLESRVNLNVSDWFSNVGKRKFDLIVSNPPYVHPNQMELLSPEVLHEPMLALTDNEDGLNAFRKIATNAKEFMVSGGRLVFEIGFDQGPEVTEILNISGFRDIRVLPDLNGNDRVVSCCSN
ncbi:MAG: peptide chain release factor N(5)-glutamine methyltransferase [Planktomarina sp.]|nr:peptide chain release factor N(5)-glutamine methyltransferase [Planktomarina sp.]